jgi:hypothetical protein
VRKDTGSLHPSTRSSSPEGGRRSRFALFAPGLILIAAALLAAVISRPARFEIPRSAAPDPAFPLAISGNGRYLVSAQGKPWRLQSEFAWLLSSKATPADIDTYLADRKAKGFNAFTVLNLVRPGGTYGWPDGNVNKDTPFLVENDFSQPNDKYFDYVDMLIDKAAAQGFAVLMFYTYAGYNGGNEGWFEVVAQSQNTKAVCYNFGRYLANRWKDKPNLILMAGGDFTMPAGETRDRMHEIHRGLREGGCKQPGGSEWNGPDSLVTDQAGYTYGVQSTSDLNLNSWYGQGPDINGRVYETADRAWSNSPILPSYMEESMQGYGKYVPLDSSRPSIRKYQNWAVLAGGTAGSNWGMFELANQFVDGQWQAQLNDIMVQDQAKAFGFYATIPWWLMRPSGTKSDYAGRNLIVSTNIRDDSFIAASLASDGSTLIAYVPPTGIRPTTFQVDLRSMAGSSRARWWNPTNGNLADITQGKYTLSAAQSAQPFTTPGDNGTGTNDWMLALDARADPSTGSGGAGGTDSGTAGSSTAAARAGSGGVTHSDSGTGGGAGMEPGGNASAGTGSIAAGASGGSETEAGFVPAEIPRNSDAGCAVSARVVTNSNLLLACFSAAYLCALRRRGRICKRLN